MTHLSREQLERWWDEGHDVDRGRVTQHLAECEACAELYESIVDARFEGATPRAETVSLRERAYAMVETARPRRPTPWARPAIVGSAAALAATLLLVAWPERRPPAAPGGEVSIRGSAIQALAPIGAVAVPDAFEWASPVRAARFVVTVRDSEGRTALELSAESERLSLTTEQVTRLQPGLDYEWQVVGLDPSGQDIIRAPWQRFRVGAPAR